MSLISASVVDFGDGTVVKYGPRVTADEGHALRLAQDYITTVPVPKVFDIITDNTTMETYIVQQKIVGTMLSEILPNMDEAVLLQVASELRAFIRELSKLDGDGTQLGLIGGAGCFNRGRWRRYDRQEYGGLRMEGIHTTERFIRWFDDYIPSCGLPREPRDNWIKEFQFHLPTIFSHGDLQPENILIHDGHISGVIDWECAGWYPYFWNDYMATLKWNPEHPWQKVVVPLMLEHRYPREVFAFRHLEHYADSYGL
jgi:aminoglycoside phosphotransferase (APT) family kinase protein